MNNDELDKVIAEAEAFYRRWGTQLVDNRVRIATELICSLIAAVKELREQIARLKAELEENEKTIQHLGVFHGDDEPSWRHRTEKLEKELAAKDEEIARLKTALEGK